jgi:hypothetical protein
MKARSGLIFLVMISLLIVPMALEAAEPNAHNASKCLLCHKTLPRFGVDTKETVTFRGGKSSDDPVLCSFCHKPEENLHPIMVEPGPDMLAAEKPSLLPLGNSGELKGKVVCTTCHFYHAAETDHSLLRGFAGSQRPGFFKSWQDFCRDCHGDRLAERSPHAGDDKACAFCHQTKPVPGKPVDVSPRGLDLCNFCHGGLQDGHFVRANPFEGPVECNTCHDPHLGPDSPGRLKPEYVDAARDRVTIDPHYRKGLCFACHTGEEGYPLRSSDPTDLCNRCHGSGEIVTDIHPLRKVPDTITPPAGWPLKDGSLACLTCHLAGHPEERESANFLRGGPYTDRNDFCSNCHDTDVLEARNPHQDVNRGEGCDFCHAERPDPETDTIDTVKLIADPNILCLRCHEPDPHPSGYDHTMNVTAEQKETISEELPLYKGSKIVCATCHNPHIEEVGNFKLRGGLTGFMICTLCHTY